VLTRSEQITKNDLTGLTTREGAVLAAGAVTPLSEVEKQHIKLCLEQLDWSISLCAEKLGIHRNTLRAKIKEFKLSRT